MDTLNRDKLKQDLQLSEDVLPTKPEDRTWRTANYGTLWMGSVHNVPSYVTIGGFFALGLSVMEVFWVIVIASVVLALAMVANSHAGSKYGIPFSMHLKMSYGSKGSVLPGVLRGVVAAIMWFGFQTYAGSLAVTILIGKIWPGYLQLGGDWNIFGLSLPALISFLLFWGLNVLLIFGGLKVLGRFTKALSILIYVVFGGMAIWAISLAGGVGALLEYTPKAMDGNAVIVFLACVTAIIATWAAPMSSVSDFTREAHSQKEQAVGQTVGLVFTYLLFAIASISVIVGSEIAFGTPIWNVLDVVERFDSGFAIAVSVLTICLTTLSVNITGNIIPAGYQLASLFPKKLNFRTGAMIAAVIGILIMPWKLMENSTSIFTFLNIIGGLLGPVVGVMLADYFIIRKKEVNLTNLYYSRGEFAYKGGINIHAYTATIVAGIFCLAGQFIPFMRPVYDVSWFAGTAVAFALYSFLMMKQGKSYDIGSKVQKEASS